MKIHYISLSMFCFCLQSSLANAQVRDEHTVTVTCPLAHKIKCEKLGRAKYRCFIGADWQSAKWRTRPQIGNTPSKFEWAGLAYGTRKKSGLWNVTGCKYKNKKLSILSTITLPFPSEYKNCVAFKGDDSATCPKQQ